MPVMASVLTIAIQLTKTEFAVGEDPTLTLELLNTGSSALVVPEPVAGSGFPRFRVVDLTDGSERLVSPPQSFPGVKARVQLDRGEPHRTFHKLSAFVPLRTPGRFSLTAVYEWNNGKDTAESAPIVVTVTGLAVRSMVINGPSLVNGTLAFINPTADPTDLVLADLVLEPEGGVRRLRPIAKAPLNATPILSLPPNQTPVMGRWVAWAEADGVRCVHEGDTLGPTAPGVLKTRGPVEIVAPLFGAPHRSNLTRGPGAAVLVRSDPVSGAELTVVSLEPDKDRARPVEVARARLERTPRWIANVFRSDAADRRFAYVTAGSGKVTVFDAPWPKAGEAALRATQVAQWDGDFVAAHVNIDRDDVIRGCLLAWMGPANERSLEVLSWSIRPGQPPASEPLGALPWPHVNPIETIKLRVRPDGTPAVLLRSALGEWHVFDGAGFEGKVFEPFTRTTLPIDLAFFSQKEAVLVLAGIGGGLVVKRLDGSDLPPVQR